MAKKRQAEQQHVETVAPGSLLDEIVSEMKIGPNDEGFTEARQGVHVLISELMGRRKTGESIDRNMVDALIAELDRRISEQMDAVIHHTGFQRLESTWKGLQFLVEHVDFRENIRVNILQARKEELLEDFEDASEIVTSGLYRQIYTAEYGQFGGKPYGAIITNYEFGVGSSDLALLRDCTAVAAMAHAPFLAAASPEIFTPGETDFQNLPLLKDLEALFEGPRYIKWRSLREAEDSRYLGLALPRFILRAPYQAEEGRVKSFAYDEEIDEHADYLWGNAVFPMATRISDSFAKFRWCPNIIGPQAGGSVEDLPIHTYEALGELKTKIPTEVLISERREFELSEAGFIALTMRKDSDNACFFSANSVQKPRYFGSSEEGKAAETNFRLGTQLPYMFIISRIAHYLKVLQRENIGTWKKRTELQRELNEWVSQYISNMDDPSPEIRSQRPLRAAQITVEEVAGEPGWYKIDMKVVPHLKYMGAFFTLSLVGKLDRE
jgi:type VI secretion system protein ImpC